MKPTYTRRLLSWRAVAFIESPSSSMLRLALLVLVGSFITCLVASFFIQLNISVTAMGVTDYLGGVKEAIAMTSGEIETLRVHDGDEVAKGQILALIRMPGISESELRSLSKLLDEKLITLDSKKIKPDGFAKRLVDIQDVNLKSALLEAEQKQTLYLYNQKVSSAQARRELDPLKRKQKVIRQQLEFIATSAVQSYLLMQKQSLEDDAGRIEQEILAAENTIATRSYDVKADAEKSIRLAQAALNAYIIAHEVRAPVAGIVGRLTAAPGGTVKDQQIIASILPLDSPVIAKVSVPTKDIAKLKENDSAYISVDAYPVYRYGYFKGKVLSIERAIEQVKPEGDVEVAYIVRISIDRDSLLRKPAGSAEDQREVRLLPGMKTEARIISKRASLMALFVAKVFRDYR